MLLSVGRGIFINLCSITLCLLFQYISSVLYDDVTSETLQALTQINYFPKILL